jgi:hypothetical protein
MRGRFRESELVEAPPHRAEIWFSLGACCPLPASGARSAGAPRSRSKYQGERTAAPPHRYSGWMPAAAITLLQRARSSSTYFFA